jgi:Ca2+-binding RTX toxin-like protein
VRYRFTSRKLGLGSNTRIALSAVLLTLTIITGSVPALYSNSQVQAKLGDRLTTLGDLVGEITCFHNDGGEFKPAFKLKAKLSFSLLDHGRGGDSIGIAKLTVSSDSISERTLIAQIYTLVTRSSQGKTSFTFIGLPPLGSTFPCVGARVFTEHFIVEGVRDGPCDGPKETDVKFAYEYTASSLRGPLQGVVDCQFGQIPGSPAPHGGCMVGTDKNDNLIGTSGNDCIVGRGGNDKIAGLAGNDKLNGNGGNDLLSGGNGNDELIGGKGADKFDCGAGNDRITDFSPSQKDIKSSNCEQF